MITTGLLTFLYYFVNGILTLMGGTLNLSIPQVIHTAAISLNGHFGIWNYIFPISEMVIGIGYACSVMIAWLGWKAGTRIIGLIRGTSTEVSNTF